jgi:hypothetical protein
MTHTSRSPLAQKILVAQPANHASSRGKIETMPPCCSLNRHPHSNIAALVDKLGPEYSKTIEGLEGVDLTSSEGKEFMSILSELDKLCAK